MLASLINKVFILILFVLSMLLGACASVPLASPEIDMKMKHLTPPHGKALLYVYRNAIFAGSAVIFEIYVDEQPVGKLAESTYLAVLLEPGKHRINSSASHTPTNDLDFTNFFPINAVAGNTYYVKKSAMSDLALVNQDKAQNDIADYKLIYESEEPTQLTKLTTAKNKPADVPQPQAQSIVPKPTATVLSDVDTLPTITTKPNKNAYAIVIGIEKYRQKLPQADFAVSDAKLMSEYLSKVMGYPEENVVTLTNEQAALGDFVKYFEKWLPNNAEPGSTVFVYYSGHGAPNPKSGDAYLVPYDGDPSFIEQTGYSLKRIYENLAKLPAKNIIVALDSCFSGAGGKSVAAKGSRALVRIEKTSARNVAVLTASMDDQTSSSYEDKGHGVFTYFLLKGIKELLGEDKNSKLELGELYNYIKPQVERTSRRLYNNEQTPQLMTADEQMKKIGLR